MAFTPRTVERTFEYAGQNYTLVFDWETFAAFEEGTELSIPKLFEGGQDGMKITRLVRLFLYGLQRNHPDLTLNHAGQMMTDPKIKDLLGASISASMPQPGDTDPEDGDTPPANPPKAAARPRRRSAGKTR